MNERDTLVIDSLIVGKTVYDAQQSLKHLDIVIREMRAMGIDLIDSPGVNERRVNVETFEGHITKILWVG